jgi:uncharacterized membrane protein
MQNSCYYKDMKTENSVLMRQARESLVGNWGLAVGTFLVYMLIAVGIQNIPKAGPILSLLVSGPMMLGITIFSLSLSRKTGPKMEQMFEGFKRFSTALSAYLLTLLFTILWSLLLIIPGIIAAMSYSMTFFILADDHTIAPSDAIKKSKKMMYGYKWKFFKLQLRFIGWALLCLLTLGIGFLWLIPYIQISAAKFYDDVKNVGGLEVKA